MVYGETHNSYENNSKKPPAVIVSSPFQPRMSKYGQFGSIIPTASRAKVNSKLDVYDNHLNYPVKQEVLPTHSYGTRA